MGDAVNLAARLEEASETGEIFVGPTTCRLTSRLFEFEPVAPLELKGKEDPVEVHRLVAAKARPKSTPEWPIEMLMKTDTLQDSLEKYRQKIAGGGRNRAQPASLP